MIIDKCKNCKWSRGYNAPNREDALLLMCVHPNIYFKNIDEVSTLCISQRIYGRFLSFIYSTCGKHARFFKQRGGDGQ